VERGQHHECRSIRRAIQQLEAGSVRESNVDKRDVDLLALQRCSRLGKGAGSSHHDNIR
jgi:hypothetical protein